MFEYMFEYLPQLLVAYDTNDTYANLVHVKHAVNGTPYFCPCCGGIVKPYKSADKKIPIYYYHTAKNCGKEKQLHFYCKNWLWKPGSKFILKRFSKNQCSANEIVMETAQIDIQKTWDTPFGTYTPDLTVYTTSGSVIYFELFFSNRKYGDNYFCQWDSLGNDVAAVSIQDYSCKTDETVIPVFHCLYHDGSCFFTAYQNRDLYFHTIAQRKHRLAKQIQSADLTRTEKLDSFWSKIQNNASKKSLLETILSMQYEDMVLCYELIKQKHSVSYLKHDVLQCINEKVIQDIRNKLDLPPDSNVFFDLKKHTNRTYEIGIRLRIQLNHISYDDFYESCDYSGCQFDKLNGYPKLVFQTSIFTHKEIKVPKEKRKELQKIFQHTMEFKHRLTVYEAELCQLEQQGYQIKASNNQYTILEKKEHGTYEAILDHYFLNTLSIKELKHCIQCKKAEQECKRFLQNIKNNVHIRKTLQPIENYPGMKCQIALVSGNFTKNENKCAVQLWICGYQVFSKYIEPLEDDFMNAVSACNDTIADFQRKYALVFDLLTQINCCKNKLWNAAFAINYQGACQVVLSLANITANNQTYRTYIDLQTLDVSNQDCLIRVIQDKMNDLVSSLEMHGCRILWKERNETDEKLIYPFY